MEFKEIETRWFGDILLVIYDWMQFPDPQNIRNLYAYDREGEQLWMAESRRPGDYFTDFAGDGTLLQAFTWDCFCCTLDPATSWIIASQFTK